MTLNDINPESFYGGMREPELGAFSCDQDETITESSWCPFCGVGENHRDIKVCCECYDIFDN